MENPINISRVMVIAALAARRSSLAQMAAQALRNQAHITSDSHLSLERFTAGGAELLLADLDDPAPAAALIDFLTSAPAGTGAIALIDNPEPDWVRAALLLPVHAILARDSSVDDLRLALQAADAGLVLLHPTSARGLTAANFSETRDDSGLVDELTGRECQVLRLVSSGFGNKEIANRLAISEHTVKFHVSSILSKLNVASRTEAVSLGIKRGIIAI
ncbi:MAG TPA: response regulator transcription factor [Candidatus Angelobacter sp.]|nr:response regulator transcription factor [Candidatus Angelobacter sp.]